MTIVQGIEMFLEVIKAISPIVLIVACACIAYYKLK